MIFDQLVHAAAYHSLSPLFAKGLKYLSEFDAATPVGRYPLEGDALFALVQEYRTEAAATRSFESHRRYADIQYIVSGREIIHYAPIDSLCPKGPHDTEKDYTLYSGSDHFPLFMQGGDFTILLPQDGHKPGCLWEKQETIKKVVVKVRLPESV